MNTRQEESERRALVTELARLVQSESWARIVPWYRRELADRMLVAKSIGEREQLAGMWIAAGDLLRQIENLVEANKGMIDGRAKRIRG